MEVVDIRQRITPEKAIHLTLDTVHDASLWCHGAVRSGGRNNSLTVILCFPVRDEDGRVNYQYADMGNWLVKHSNGLFEVYTQEKFDRIYEVF